MSETKEKEKSQISWGSLNEYTRLFADVPVTNERIWFEIADLHETWKAFLLAYGVKQFVSSALAKVSFSPSATAKAALAIANASEDVEAIKIARETLKTEKATWLKANATEIRSALWKELQALKVERVKREATGRATKASIEAAAVKAENDRLITLAIENAKKLNIPVEIAMQLMGVKPIEQAPADEPEVDVLNDENLDGNE